MTVVGIVKQQKDRQVGRAWPAQLRSGFPWVKSKKELVWVLRLGQSLGRNSREKSMPGLVLWKSA